MSNPLLASTPQTTPPPAETAIDEALVRRLLRDQHPDLARRPLVFAAEGWDNVTYRCGDDLAVRLPRRALGATTLDVELAWLPQVAPHLPLRTPAALRTGEPGSGYPWRWAVVPWIEGAEAAVAEAAPAEGPRLGEFLRALHDVELPENPPVNPYRGGPLAERAGVTTRRLDELEAGDDPPHADFEVLRRWFAAGVDVARDAGRTWIHGDLHSRNVLVDDGRLAAVIDWGDMCAGDPCTDLAAVWMLFAPDHHEAVWDVYRPSPSTLARTRAWVVAFGAMLMAAGRKGDTVLETVGRTALERIGG